MTIQSLQTKAGAAAVALKKKAEAAAKTLRQVAVAEYENLVWQTAESDDYSGVEDHLDVLHAADKSIDDFATDVEQIKQRIGMEGDIAEYSAIGDEIDEITEKIGTIENELEGIRAAYESKIAVLDGDAKRLRRREDAVRPAVRFFRVTAPAWLRDRLDELKMQEERAARDKHGLHAPAGPPVDDDHAVVRHYAHDADSRRRMDKERQRATERYRENQQAFQEAQNELRLRTAELARQRAAIEKTLLLLRPEPSDLEAALLGDTQCE